MSQRLLHVRVRPARAVVLINKASQPSELLLAFTFFSSIWGGRFGQIMPVAANACDDLTIFRLDRSRPDFVYGIELDDDHWASAVRDACQPRGYGRLRAELVDNVDKAHAERYFTTGDALVHLFRERRHKSVSQRLRLIAPAPSSPLAIYCAAIFGVHYSDLSHDYYDEESQLSDDNHINCIDLATEFAKEWQQSWLDVTGHALDTHSTFGSPLAPTIVLVRNEVSDLALFWNLRSSSSTTYPAWIIPIPAERATERTTLDKLKNWLLAFAKYGATSNYCYVTSQAGSNEECRHFARAFSEVLAGTPYETVSYKPPPNRLPHVVPYEYDATWTTDISGRRLVIQPPKPRAFEPLSSRRAWFVDLLKDTKTKRAVKELHLPSSSVVPDLLNGPCPPSFEYASVPRVADCGDYISIRCSGGKEVVSVYLPTADELLGEILREHGVEPIPDEKRNSYHPVMRRFGGLQLAASAFSGQRGTILRVLAKETKTPAELQGACKLANGKLEGNSYLQNIENMLAHESDRMKRVARKRFSEYAGRFQPATRELKSLLENLADRGILTRRWQIGPCESCRQKYFVRRLDIERSVICNNCGHRIGLPPRVPIAYKAQRAVAHAIQEGIMPVALTGRFLHGMTNSGFFWLPGVKYRESGRCGDVDVLACCDGRLVFCECKDLDSVDENAAVWQEVVDQFVETARIATRCKANLVVLASRARKYPAAALSRIAEALNEGMPYLLLDKQDLETGYRRDPNGPGRLSFAHSDVSVFPEQPSDPVATPKKMTFG